MTKLCRKCRCDLPLEAFSKRRDTPDGCGYYCKECRAAVHRETYVPRPRKHYVRKPPPPRRRDKMHEARIKCLYGLTREQFDAMLLAQQGRCAICPEPLRLLHIDHDHQTGKVRGLLCSACNTGLGLLGDTPEALMAAVEYLHAAR